MALEREAGERHLGAADLEPHRPRPVQQVDPGMGGQQRVGDRRALVVARHDDHRHAAGGDLDERLERPVDQLAPHLAAVQQVAAVHHQVHLAPPRRRQRPLEVGEEVGPAPPPLDPRPLRQVEPQMGVGQKQKAEATHHGVIMRCPVAVVTARRRDGR